MTTVKRNWKGSASRERATLSMTASRGVSSALSTQIDVLTNWKDETPSRNHEGDMGYDGAGVFSVGEVAHWAIRGPGVGCWLRRAVRHVHVHFRVHRFMGGREGDKSREGGLGS